RTGSEGIVRTEQHFFQRGLQHRSVEGGGVEDRGQENPSPRTSQARGKGNRLRRFTRSIPSNPSGVNSSLRLSGELIPFQSSPGGPNRATLASHVVDGLAGRRRLHVRDGRRR